MYEELLKRINKSIENPRPTKRIRILNEYDTLLQRLLNFIEKHSNIQQHTPEWLRIFTDTIGGTEIYKLYKPGTLIRLMQEKLNGGSTTRKNQFVRIVPFTWGNLFEGIIRPIIEIILDTQIYGNTICIKDGYFRYSPDGLGVVPCKKSGGFTITLFEFKCPITRNPDGVIPERYKYQVRAGLVATEEITDNAMYVEGVFRKCSKNQLGDTPDYDREYHMSDHDDSYQKPLAWGVINVYSKKSGHGAVIDYGKAGKKVFNDMLEDVNDGKLTTSFSYVKFAESMHVSVLEHLFTQGIYDDRCLVGIIPFKLMKLWLKEVERDPNDKQDMIRRIDEVFTHVK